MSTTRIAGILGGLGPESTIDYYRRIVAEWQRDDPTSSPSLVIDSLDVTRGLYLSEHDHAGLEEYLHASLMRLVGAGADFIAMAANTPHLVYDELAARCPVPIISIVETCADEARRVGLTRLALFGTRFTMQAPFYPRVFGRYGMQIFPPLGSDRDWAHEHYVGELLKGIFRDETREGYVALIGKLRDQHKLDGIILGGTELTILMPDPTVGGLPVLDTTALHVSSIVRALKAA
jgi:aspartate racemase